MVQVGLSDKRSEVRGSDQGQSTPDSAIAIAIAIAIGKKLRQNSDSDSYRSSIDVGAAWKKVRCNGVSN